MAALAQETRLDAFRLLAMSAPDGLQATRVADLLRVAKNSMSQHFRVLEDAGLVTAERHGRNVIYRANLKTYDALLSYL